MVNFFLFCLRFVILFSFVGNSYAQYDVDASLEKEKLENECKQDIARSCFDVAVLYKNGQGVIQNDNKAKEFYKKACDLNHAYGCYAIKVSLNENPKENNELETKNIPETYSSRFERESKKYLKKNGYNQKNVDNFINNRTQLMSMDNTALPSNFRQDVLQASGSTSDSFKNIENLKITDDENKNFKLESLKDSHEKECDLNNAKSCAYLGILYMSGEEVKQDYQQAKTYLEKGCDLNDANSCAYLGSLYFLGKEVKQDYQQAKTYLEKGCDLNESWSCTLVGILYADGQGVEQDYTTAKKYYEKACDLKNGGGCSNLGVLYHNERGVEQDYQQAKVYYEKACNLNIGVGCHNIGTLYTKGQGVEQDYATAQNYWKKGCDLGYKKSCKLHTDNNINTGSIQDNTPEYHLKNAYKNYLKIKECSEIRNGYALVYITEQQLIESKNYIREIENFYKENYSDKFNSDDIWKEAVTEFEQEGKTSIDGFLGIKHLEFNELTQLSCKGSLVGLQGKYHALFKDKKFEKDF